MFKLKECMAEDIEANNYGVDCVTPSTYAQTQGYENIVVKGGPTI